jgi:hypothetical protein
MTIIIILTCWALAAMCNAVMDTLAFKFKRSIFRNMNEQYWNPAKSWRNKYKNKMAYQGAAFPGSTTTLSFVTDAWHLFQFLSNSFLALSVVVVFHDLFNLSIGENIIVFLGLKLVWGITFETFYSSFLRKK